jgi:hypothetical protein
MADPMETKKQAQETLEKLRKKTSVTDAELTGLQQHFDVLERAVAASHHHDHDSTREA